MTLAEIENAMEINQAAWLVCIYLVRRDSLWQEADYRDYEDYAQRRWGVSRRQADHWAAAGEILLDLFPALDPVKQAGGEQIVPWSPATGRPGAAIAPGRLRPLVALKRSGFSAEEIRDVWRDIMEHTTLPSAKQVQEEVILHKQEALRGCTSPVGAEALRQLIAAHVYDLVRAESDSDELAVRCREAVIEVLWEFAADEEEEK